MTQLSILMFLKAVVTVLSQEASLASKYPFLEWCRQLLPLLRRAGRWFWQWLKDKNCLQLLRSVILSENVLRDTSLKTHPEIGFPEQIQRPGFSWVGILWQMFSVWIGYCFTIQNLLFLFSFMGDRVQIISSSTFPYFSGLCKWERPFTSLACRPRKQSNTELGRTTAGQENRRLCLKQCKCDNEHCNTSHLSSSDQIIYNITYTSLDTWYSQNSK